MIAVRTTESTLEKMQREGFERGSRIELILKKGAEYDSWAPAGACDLAGYEPGDGMTNEPGLKILGYVMAIKDSRVEIAHGWEGERPARLGGIYACEETIYDFK
jgi:hypothetical protein